ncbi:MAG: WecB/TagA/CpsF family glycosyltransferase, partial [Anaerolineae bacterium]|nr:WecB/TagA/CpsF family glycosyltransferase [Anaerolineae bacterium]
SLGGLLELCDESLAVSRQRVVLNVNAHAVVLAEGHPAFREALRSADVVFCDGVGVRLAARWLGTPLPARFTPPDWIDQLGRLCLAHGRSIFLLGSTATSVARAAAALRQRVPGLVVQAHHGYFDKQGAENEAVIAEVNAAQPGALLVGFGMPLQELWITANRARLNAAL